MAVGEIRLCPGAEGHGLVMQAQRGAPAAWIIQQRSQAQTSGLSAAHPALQCWDLLGAIGISFVINNSPNRLSWLCRSWDECYRFGVHEVVSL